MDKGYIHIIIHIGTSDSVFLFSDVTFNEGFNYCMHFILITKQLARINFVHRTRIYFAIVSYSHSCSLGTNCKYKH